MSMKRLLQILAGLGCATTLFLWLGSRPDGYVNFPPSASGAWVAFGDSLTEGHGSSPGHDYPTLLSQRLGITITNFGRSGITTPDGLNRLENVGRRQSCVLVF